MTIQIRRIREPTFVGAFGEDYLMYSFPTNDYAKEIVQWKSHPNLHIFSETEAYRYENKYVKGAPNWWFYKDEAKRIAVLKTQLPASGERSFIYIYTSSNDQCFFIFYYWGH